MILGRHLVFATAFVGACYTEGLPPPGFRYACSDDSDCLGQERCEQGRCLVGCTLATAADDCSLDVDYAACFNGFCTTVCTVGEEHCTSPETCISGDDEDGALGVCGRLCSTLEDCPAGEECLAGICGPPCDPDATTSSCPEGTSCVGGICVQF
jgi:hypothetical protein